ncbi:MAG: hypothetical protein FJZ38_10185 [Candidatus Rokubacteria bacterium]|nr:hypothetical protein [Candidatus Rokubacteria bacterium]
MFAVAFAVIIELSAVLTIFLSLSAADLDRIRLGKILSLIGVATFLLLATLFGFMPHDPLQAAPPLGLLVISAALVVVVGVLVISALVVLISDSRHRLAY